MEVRTVADNSINNETEHRNQELEVRVDLVESIIDIDNLMEVRIYPQDGNRLNILHFNLLLDLIKKKSSPFQSNGDVLTLEGKRVKKWKLNL